MPSWIKNLYKFNEKDSFRNLIFAVDKKDEDNRKRFKRRDFITIQEMINYKHELYGKRS